MHSPESLSAVKKKKKNQRQKKNVEVKTHVLSRLPGRLALVCAGNDLMACAGLGSGWLEDVPQGLGEVLAGAGSLLSHGNGLWSPQQRQAGRRALLTRRPQSLTSVCRETEAF